MSVLQQIADWIPKPQTEDIPPLPSPNPCRSKFESLPTELRLQIYSLLLNGKLQSCFLERCEIGPNYSFPQIYPAILAVNRSISAEAYPVLYTENKFLFLGTTNFTEWLDGHQESLSRLAGLPKLQKPPLLPPQSRQLINHVVAAPLKLARHDWVSRLLQLAPATTAIDFDFWITSYSRPPVLEPLESIPVLNASIPAIKSLVNESTQTFRIGIRRITSYYESIKRLPRRKRVELPSMHLAVVNLKGLDDLQEKRRKVHKALQFIIEIMRQRAPLRKNTMPPDQALVGVDKRMLLHRDFAGFWSPDEFPVQVESKGWVPFDTDGRIVEIGLECRSINWRRLNMF